MICFNSKYSRPVRAKGSLILLLSFSFISIFLSELPAISQDKNPADIWNSNTAYLIQKNKWETGLFQQFRYGLSDRIELNASAILFPVLPNAGIKIRLGDKGKFHFASEHSVSIPSIFLNVVSFKGTGALISPQYSFSFMTSVSNKLFVTIPAGPNSLISADAGIAFALRTEKPDYQSTIDIPFIYQRTAHWYDGASITTEVLYKGKISGSLYFEECARLFVITRSTDNLFVENSGNLMWASKGSIRLKAGYLLSWGRYPFGEHWQMWPSIDIIFGSKVKK